METLYTQISLTCRGYIMVEIFYEFYYCLSNYLVMTDLLLSRGSDLNEMVECLFIFRRCEEAP